MQSLLNLCIYVIIVPLDGPAGDLLALTNGSLGIAGWLIVMSIVMVIAVIALIVLMIKWPLNRRIIIIVSANKL